MRGLDLGHLNQRDAQRPDVGLVVVRGVLHGLAHHHFGGHPEPTRGQQSAKTRASTGASRGSGSRTSASAAGPDQSSFPPAIFLRTVFSQKDAFQAASQPSPAAAPSPTRRGQQRSRTQGPGEGAGGGRAEGTRGEGAGGRGKKIHPHRGAGEKRRRRNKRGEREGE